MGSKSWDVKINTGIKQATKEAAAKALLLAAEHVLAVSTKRVPHDKGTLSQSGKTGVDKDNLRAVISYNTPYAVRQHEDMTLKHPNGRSAKYLESALTGEAEKVRQIIIQELEGAWR